jgi:hypothetical protein
MTANLSVVRSPPLKGIAKVRLDFMIVDVQTVRTNSRVLWLEWETRSAGFGTLRFAETADGATCDNEGMDRAFVANVLQKAIEGVPRADWPDLLRGGVDALIERTSPQQPW